ncbi:MAG: aminotransferase class V-fold PLP-dependent enzyme, partial [Devosiaceae bacterium]|nr:aminotransferase class V-fold PLP-dependent enzyme [Devosiaceae bacterium]
MVNSNVPLDSAKIRALFPAFSAPNLQGQAFFENAGGSYTCQPVLDKLDRYYRQTKVQPYAPYPASIEAGNAMDLSYERIGAAMGLAQEWIHFGPSTSANAYVLSQAFSQWLNPGDAIIVTNQDHEANSGFWRRLQNHNIEVREWKMDPQSASLNIADLENLLDEKVRFVSFPHCSNIVGEINPAKQICATIHAAGALAIVDGVSYAPHGLPDVKDMNADIYFFSAYKMYGPHVGTMAIRPELAMDLPVQGHHFNNNAPRYRLTPAGPDHAQIAAMSGIVDYLEIIAKLAGEKVSGDTPFQRAHNAMRATEENLMQPLLDWLSKR